MAFSVKIETRWPCRYASTSSVENSNPWSLDQRACDRVWPRAYSLAAIVSSSFSCCSRSVCSWLLSTMSFSRSRCRRIS
jgi:hypothetical protein